jgi:hypothetical protein
VASPNAPNSTQSNSNAVRIIVSMTNSVPIQGLTPLDIDCLAKHRERGSKPQLKASLGSNVNEMLELQLSTTIINANVNVNVHQSQESNCGSNHRLDALGFDLI